MSLYDRDERANECLVVWWLVKEWMGGGAEGAEGAIRNKQQ